MRFQLRSLMLAIAGLALACAAVFRYGEIAVFIGIALLLSVGPLVGSVRAGLLYQEGRLDTFSAALFGGFLQATLLTPVVGLVIFWNAPTPPIGILVLFAIWLVLLLLHVVSGYLVGLFVCFFFAVWKAPRTVITCHAKYRGAFDRNGIDAPGAEDKESEINAIALILADCGDPELREPSGDRPT